MNGTTGRVEFQAGSSDRLCRLSSCFAHLDGGDKVAHPFETEADLRAISSLESRSRRRSLDVRRKGTAGCGCHSVGSFGVTNARDLYGEVELLPDTFRTSASGDLVSLVEKFSAYSGHLRATGHGLWKCQPDGSLKYAVDMFGMSDPK